MFCERMPAANVCDCLTLEYKIERHIERQTAHVTRVLEGNHVIHLRINQHVFILEQFQSNSWS